MIRYDLICEHGHVFDGWFSDSKSFDQQVDLGLINCTQCGSTNVEKTLMAPNVATSKKDEIVTSSQEPAVPVANNHQMNLPTEMVEMMRKARQHIIDNSENVGDKFAESARKIHYNEEPQRNILGQATVEEISELADEGIESFPLPVLPEDNN